MASTEMTWRKMPRNIMTDPNMDYIASCLPHEYAAAPYMFYMTALSIADDDGIFDLEDGIIFSRLMHCGTPELIFTIANLMLKRKIITRAGNSSKCMLTSWDYSIKEKPRTLEDRRRIVQKQIEAEQAARSNEFTDLPCEEEIINVEFTTPKMSDAFLCPENDKSAKNVVNVFFDDKNQENVVKKNETEKIREDKNREIEREEHTQNRLDTDREPLRATDTALRGLEESGNTEPTAEEYPEWDGTETNGSNDVAELVEQAFKAGQGVQIDEQKKRAFGVFEAFFAKNCLGFNANEHISQLYELSGRVCRLSDEKNPPEIIASCLVSQFKKLTEDEGYYKNCPVTPEELLKPGAYKHSLAAASRILLTNKQVNSQWAEQLELQQEIEAEKAEVGDVFQDEYLKYGIDPNNPNKAALLMRAKARANCNSGAP